jgi:hypothetical protein
MSLYVIIYNFFNAYIWTITLKNATFHTHLHIHIKLTDMTCYTYYQVLLTP